jgi:ribosomal protein S27E
MTPNDDQSYLHKLIEEQLGYQFSENELSPDTRAKIIHYKPKAARLREIYLGNDEVSKSKSVMWIIYLVLALPSLIFGTGSFIFGLVMARYTHSYETLVLGGIGLFIAFVLSLLFLPRLRNMQSTRIGEEYSRLRSDMSSLAKEIHDELVEAHKRKIGPQEVIHYQIVTDFSFKDGALAVRCPNCAGNIDIVKGKLEGNKYKCAYCGSTIVIPDKIFKML